MSIVKLRTALGAPVVPPASVAVAVMACAPWLSGVLGVQLQLPPASAVAVQMTVAPSFTTTAACGSLVPTRVGVLLLATIAFCAGCEIAGAAGAEVSTVKERVVLGPVLPAGSVWLTVKVCGPSLNGVVGVQLQLPLASTVAVQTVFGPSFTVTVAPGSPVPLMVG